jgi:magnesium-transporting ATPase (P-type)
MGKVDDNVGKKVDVIKELVKKIIKMLCVISAFIFTILVFVYFVILINSVNNNTKLQTNTPIPEPENALLSVITFFETVLDIAK